MSEHTRQTKTSKTLIDNVITNNYNVSVKNFAKHKIADHKSSIDINIKREQKNPTSEHIKDRNIFRYNKSAFYNDLNMVIDFEQFNNINEISLMLDKNF